MSLGHWSMIRELLRSCMWHGLLKWWLVSRLGSHGYCARKDDAPDPVVGVQTTQMQMTTVGGFSYNVDPNSIDNNSFTTVGLFDQINMTRDSADYPVLTVMSASHSVHVFINGQLTGTAYGSVEDPRLMYTGNVKLLAGSKKNSLLNIVVRLPISCDLPKACWQKQGSPSQCPVSEDIQGQTCDLPKTCSQDQGWWFCTSHLISVTQVQGPYIPIEHEETKVGLVKVTKEMESFMAYAKLRLERMKGCHVAVRQKRAVEIEKEEKK